MKLLPCLICPTLLLVFVGSTNITTLNINSFVNVILDIRKFYSAATVIFAHPADKYNDYGNLQVTHLVHTCSRMLGRHHVVTLNIHFGMLQESLLYHRRIVQPIAIVILPDLAGYMKFGEATKTFYMAFPVWFVLFLFAPAKNAHDLCRNPIGNPFNLAFNTQMLVLCHDDDILREWYSVKGETTKVFRLAKWKPKKGFVLLSKLALYDRRKDLEGTVLQAVLVKDESVSPKYHKNYVAGLYDKVLDELTESLNFTLKVISEISGHGMWNKSNRTWSGIMGEIVSGRADFAIADMSMTSLRVRYVDFTLPLIISRNSLFIREPGICGVKWLGYFQTFKPLTWSAILTLILIAPFLLCFMNICRRPQNALHLISDNFVYIWGIFCQQAIIEFPRSSSLRIAYFTIFCSAILISAYYSAALVCFLTACTRIVPFRTIDEFVNDGTYKLIVPSGSADYDVLSASNTTFSVKLMRVMKKESELPENLLDGFVQVCNERKLAYLVLNALMKSVEMRIPCKLSAISTERIDNLGMVLSKSSPYTDVINYHLQKFLDNGMMMRLRDTRFLMQSDIIKSYEPVRVASVAPILSILCGGIVFSIVMLIMEKIHFQCKRKRERKRRHLRAFYRSKKQLFITK